MAKARPRRSPLEFQAAREEVAAAQIELELGALREELANLEESRQLFEELYDFAPVGYFSLDRRGCIRGINLTGAQLLSQRRTHLLGKPLLPLVSPPDRRKFLNHLARLRRGQKEVTTELQVGVLGTPLPVQLVSAQAGQARCEPLYKTVIVDLSERKRNEEALRESEMRFRLMADAAPVMIWISGPDKSCTYFNQGWLEFTGRTLEQELGGGWAASIHPEDLKLCLATYESAFDARRAFQMEYRLRRYDGAYRWLLAHGVPRFLPDGEFLGYIGSCIDITERKQAEEALRQSEARMRHILEAALDAIITFDRDSVITGWNPQAEASLGWSRQEAIGLKLTDAIIPPRYRAAFEQGLRHYLDTGENPLQDKRIELAVLHRDGHEFPVEVAITPLVLADYLAFSAFVRDISERKAVEQVLHRSHEEMERLVSERTRDLTKAMADLQASETRFRGFVESAPDAVVITDEQGRIVLGNAQAERLFGYTRQELEAQPIEMLIPKRHRHAGHRADYLAWSQARPMGSDLESFGLRKDGSEFPVEIGFSSLQTPNGTLVTAAISDITQRKQAEQALRESQERLTAIMEHTPALIFLKDIRGRYLHFNRQFAQTFKLGLQQVIGKTDAEIFPPAQATAFRANDSKVIKARAPIQFEEVAMHEDGLHTSLVTKFPLFNLQGKIYAVGGIVTDITERKRVEEALEQSRAHYLALSKEARAAQEAARKFAGLVLSAQENERKRISRELHDDVGQDLNVVSLSMAALKKKVDQGDSLKPGQIREIQEMLERTMETVHCFARELRPSMLDELGLLPALRSHLKNLSERTGLNVCLRADPRAEELGVEEKLVLFRVAQESLNNVVKHARASRVQVALCRTVRGVMLSVSDNGKSFRADANGMGRGKRLGLLGMQERVRLVNGRFSILPQPGKGTRVRVMIPLGSSTNSSTPPHPALITPAP